MRRSDLFSSGSTSGANFSFHDHHAVQDALRRAKQTLEGIEQSNDGGISAQVADTLERSITRTGRRIDGILSYVTDRTSVYRQTREGDAGPGALSLHASPSISSRPVAPSHPPNDTSSSRLEETTSYHSRGGESGGAMAHRRDPDADAELAPSSRRSRQSEAAYVDVAGAESWRKEEQENEAEEEKEKEEKEKEKEKEKEEEKEKENKDETETAEMRKGRNKEEEAVVEENGDAAELLMGMDSFRGASLTFTPERSRVMDAMLSRTGAKRSQTWRMSDQTSPDPPALQPPWSTALKTGGDGVTSASGRSRVWFRAGREEEDEEGSNAEDGGSGLLQADDAVQQDLFKDMVGTAAGDADSSSAWSGRMRMKARTSKLARREVENDLMEFCGMSPISLSMRSISSPLSVFPSTAKKFAATGGGGGREGEALEHPAIRPSKRLSEILNGGSESFEEEVQQVIRNVERYRSENELSSINCSLSKEEAASLHESLQNLGKSIDSSMRNLEKVMNLQAAQTRHVREEIERVIDQRVAEAETSQL